MWLPELLEPFAPEDPYYGDGTLAARSLPDGREIHLLRQLYNVRVALTDEPQGRAYEDAFCFHVLEHAWAFFHAWDGKSYPAVPWAKRPFTGERGPCDCRGCLALRRLEVSP